jgi:hypothetical protein
MSEHHELASGIDDAAELLAYAEEQFAKLAALTEVVQVFADRPDMCRILASGARDIARELANSFGEFKREYDSKYRRIHNDKQSLSDNECV